MISALLSNSAISSVRGSGLAGDPRGLENSDENARGNVSKDQADSAPALRSQQNGNVQPLTLQAVLALQEGSDTATARQAPEDGGNAGNGQRDGAGERTATPSPSSSSNTQPPPSSAAAEKAAAETAAAAGNGQSDPQEDEADPDGDGLNEAEEKQVRELQQRDREVRAHEQAHARVGGAYAGAPSYSFQQGPDGKRYAIGGEVSIDTSTERTPEATIRKMQIVIRAATAPAEPSSQDLKVAQQARAQLAEAQAQLRAESAEELRGGDEEGVTNQAPNVSERAASDTNTIAITDGNAAGDARRSDVVAATRAYELGASTASGNPGVSTRPDPIFA